MRPSTYTLPVRNRQALLVRRPTGIPAAEDFEVSPSEVPQVSDGRFLVRNLYLSVDPAQRGWAADSANYSAAVPLGTTMRALAVGVVTASRCDGVQAGEVLYGWFGWQYFSLAEPKDILLRGHFPVPIIQYLGLLGINGLAAYLALHDIGRPRAGDTLLVSTAAGAVGSLAGQIGKILGCRTIGLTGTDEKAERCRAKYRYDVAINYRDGDWIKQLAQAVGDGVDVFFDNTGGPILDAAIRHMAVGGRIIQCGTVAISSWSGSPQGPRNEREMLVRRLLWGGFVIFDHQLRFEAAAAQLARWYLDGLLSCDVDLSTGIDSAPGAIESLYAGRNDGKKIIDVSAA